MIEVFNFPIQKRDIQALPAEDRFAFILSGHALNHLGMWLKLISLATNESPTPTVIAYLRSSQSHMLVRQLYSLLYETWIWIKTEKTKLHIERKYLPYCTAEEKAAYESLRLRFENSDLLGSLRNKFSSHFPNRAQVEEAFLHTPEEGDWSAYLSHNMTNSYWCASELTIGYGSIKLAGASDPNEGLRLILKECMFIANQMQDFLSAVLRLIMEKHLGGVPQPSIALQIADAPRGDEFELPFLLEPPLGQGGPS